MTTSETRAEDLFRACAAGDASAWEEFIRRYKIHIHITALRVARRFGLGQELESLIADFYGDLYRRRDRVLGSFIPHWPGADVPYLKTVTANAVSTMCREIIRRNGVEIPNDNDVPPTVHRRGDGPEITLDEAERILRRELDPRRVERDIAIFNFHYREGLTAGEIANVRSFALSEAGVEAVLHTCRKKLKNVLKEPQGKCLRPSLGKEKD